MIFPVYRCALRRLRRLRGRSFSTSAMEVAFRGVRKVLCVAEKNDAAKGIADLLSQGRMRRREGLSKFNKIYEFDYHLYGQNVTMIMTSVSGHLLAHDFKMQFRKWQSCNPLVLFEAEIEKYCPENFVDIKRTLERETRQCQALVIWTDCDREGENIGFEIIHVCKAVKPSLQVLRARFSEITPRAIRMACEHLAEPDQRVSDAVDVRQELDLRIGEEPLELFDCLRAVGHELRNQQRVCVSIRAAPCSFLPRFPGAAFTRFQTLRLQKIFPQVLAEQLISYGSCQFPTLGFVVERFKAIQAFVPEVFHRIKVTHDHRDGTVEFNWKRHRLFNHTACLVLYQLCMEDPMATVVEVSSKAKSKWRPQALDTVELEKLASRKLRINAKETMRIAEKLYTQGYISYPRTETNIFPRDLNLTALVEQQTADPGWGPFAQSILERGGPTPRNGSKSDQAHPPIHPTKYTSSLQVGVPNSAACWSPEGGEGQCRTGISHGGLSVSERSDFEIFLPFQKKNVSVKILLFHNLPVSIWKTPHGGSCSLPSPTHFPLCQLLSLLPLPLLLSSSSLPLPPLLLSLSSPPPPPPPPLLLLPLPLPPPSILFFLILKVIHVHFRQFRKYKRL
uniref:DNA topoisomerase n=1 Tax=Molossus molossus TaxID=27622 RepID=A0A7J8BKG7_MOLMO|nr:DNA topoisomerase III alpha [Molossus molossus]